MCNQPKLKVYFKLSMSFIMLLIRGFVFLSVQIGRLKEGNTVIRPGRILIARPRDRDSDAGTGAKAASLRSRLRLKVRLRLRMRRRCRRCLEFTFSTQARTQARTQSHTHLHTGHPLTHGQPDVAANFVIFSISALAKVAPAAPLPLKSQGWTRERGALGLRGKPLRRSREFITKR